ncbi:malate dehydrogenase (quinone) [Halomonas sp. McH1-25]|uniref:malate dehydrogenase (quinone) n=1 Tax=unclassified Halomonas TaxID=2609666 RepID=UPI001EF6F0D5|nr:MULTISPECIES: malate dehydrogenase (quinone) [unclassified Halomonas]MCG7600401.1 malate dehydrogenase (quinone) [Halomonas sp. McH1-25]MCP1343167.1 malate dehydrogenase (quinone) [Halomonas sp. FL8]MCP1362043.1 malate dehydrogenase (quinone) [Halomonas sp. BBD45]MCP1363872.1 malate dehydrogenase (quinone) [Halomonas sp. BBD48]
MDETVDVLLVGAGVMSATLATLLHELEPDARIEVLERLDSTASESSFAWNNAGTGHAGLCELNYTPQTADGSVDIQKAIKINTMFEESKQFWTYLVEHGNLGDPSRFVYPVPHMSFVRGQQDVRFLRARHEVMQSHPCFEAMKYTESPETIAQWAPLLMDGRQAGEPLAATRVESGTDVDFGALTRQLLARLEAEPDEQVRISTGQKVSDLERNGDGSWTVKVDTNDGERRVIRARFVFLGAGGASLHLLQKSGIPEAKGYAGFPVSGQWLRCDKPEIVSQHNAKVYSKAPIGAPPMSVPHLDTRNVDGTPSLLFGPFAGFTTKFLKTGSVFDLARSVRSSNLSPMLAVARDNFSLVKYLLDQVRLSHDERVEELQDFYPAAAVDDWRLEVAGQRVQVIKKDPKKGGILQFGTEVVASSDGSIAALLGASPGASTATSIMLGLVERCFPEKFASAAWQARLEQLVPARADTLAAQGALLRDIREHTHRTLKLSDPSA